MKTFFRTFHPGVVDAVLSDSQRIIVRAEKLPTTLNEPIRLLLPHFSKNIIIGECIINKVEQWLPSKLSAEQIAGCGYTLDQLIRYTTGCEDNIWAYYISEVIKYEKPKRYSFGHFINLKEEHL